MVKSRNMQNDRNKNLPVIVLLIVWPVLLVLVLFTVHIFFNNRRIENMRQARTADCYRFHSCEILDMCPTELGSMKCDFIGENNPNHESCLDEREKCLSNIK